MKWKQISYGTLAAIIVLAFIVIIAQLIDRPTPLQPGERYGSPHFDPAFK